MHLVFNELSMNTIPNDKNDGCKIFELFLKTYSSAVGNDFGFSREIYTTLDLNNVELAHGYYAAEWRNQKDIDKDLRILYKRICDLQIVQTVDDDSEISYNGINGAGLNLAYQNNMTLISLNSDWIWNKYELECAFYELDTDETTIVTVYNLYNQESLDNNKEAISLHRENDICKTADELLRIIDSRFPSLIFHKVAQTQIKQELQKQHVSTVYEKLLKLEQYFCSWDGTKFDMTSFPNKCVSPESTKTLQDFKDQHTFRFDDATVIVSYHMRYTGSIPGRIYFFPDSALKKARICSLTTKLPTVKYPKSKI